VELSLTCEPTGGKSRSQRFDGYKLLRDQPSLLGEVASDATAWRTLAALEEARLGALRRARASARARVWEQAGAPERVILDLDATLITAHSDKEEAAGTYKGGFGFHPLLCYEAMIEEALAGLLRPGNAGFNTAADHIQVLERSLAHLPEQAIGPGLLVPSPDLSVGLAVGCLGGGDVRLGRDDWVVHAQRLCPGGSPCG
jgi:hypothetical protein